MASSCCGNGSGSSSFTPISGHADGTTSRSSSWWSNTAPRMPTETQRTGHVSWRRLIKTNCTSLPLGPVREGVRRSMPPSAQSKTSQFESDDTSSRPLPPLIPTLKMRPVCPRKTPAHVHRPRRIARNACSAWPFHADSAPLPSLVLVLGCVADSVDQSLRSVSSPADTSKG